MPKSWKVAEISPRWSRIVDEWLNSDCEDHQCYPLFDEFCQFLERETRIACNSVNFKQSVIHKQDLNQPRSRTQNKSIHRV